MVMKSNIGGGAVGKELFRLQQCIVNYEWDGERATGMLERSSANAEVG